VVQVLFPGGLPILQVRPLMSYHLAQLAVIYPSTLTLIERQLTKLS